MPASRRSCVYEVCVVVARYGHKIRVCVGITEFYFLFFFYFLFLNKNIIYCGWPLKVLVVASPQHKTCHATQPHIYKKA